MAEIEPKILRDRRLQGQHLQDTGIDAQVEIVDLVVRVDHRLRLLVVVLHQGVDGSLHGCPGQLAHAEQLELGLLQLLVEGLARHPNRPVT